MVLINELEREKRVNIIHDGEELRKDKAGVSYGVQPSGETKQTKAISSSYILVIVSMLGRQAGN